MPPLRDSEEDGKSFCAKKTTDDMDAHTHARDSLYCSHSNPLPVPPDLLPNADGISEFSTELQPGGYSLNRDFRSMR